MVLTDGLALPRSIWLIIPAETPAFAASSRIVRLRSPLRVRSLAPIILTSPPAGLSGGSTDAEAVFVADFIADSIVLDAFYRRSIY